MCELFHLMMDYILDMINSVFYTRSARSFSSKIDV